MKIDEEREKQCNNNKDWVLMSVQNKGKHMNWEAQ